MGREGVGGMGGGIGRNNVEGGEGKDTTLTI